MIQNKKHYLKLFAISLLSLGIIISQSSCKKVKPVEPQLPAVTFEGKNTFGCRVGKDLWVYSPVSYRYKLDVNYQDDGELYFHCSRPRTSNSREADNMFLRFNNILGTGSFDLMSEVAEIKIFFPEATYDTLESGNLTISFIDKTRKIISGTFSFRVKSSKTGQSLEIKEGRFDVTYLIL